MTTEFIIELGKYIQNNDNFIEPLVNKHNLLKAEYELKLEKKTQNVIDTIINLENVDDDNYNIYLQKVEIAKFNINYI